MPATQIELGHSHKSLDRVFDLCNGKHSFGMRHEAALAVRTLLFLTK